MFQDEKTTELDLNAFTESKEKPVSTPRWTEKPASQSAHRVNAQTASINLQEKHSPLLLKLAAAVTILILSLWLF